MEAFRDKCFLIYRKFLPYKHTDKWRNLFNIVTNTLQLHNSLI